MVAALVAALVVAVVAIFGLPSLSIANSSVRGVVVRVKYILIHLAALSESPLSSDTGLPCTLVHTIPGRT